MKPHTDLYTSFVKFSDKYSLGAYVKSRFINQISYVDVAHSDDTSSIEFIKNAIIRTLNDYTINVLYTDSYFFYTVATININCLKNDKQRLYYLDLRDLLARFNITVLYLPQVVKKSTDDSIIANIYCNLKNKLEVEFDKRLYRHAYKHYTPKKLKCKHKCDKH